ncbi:MAG: hypothetical protein R3C28_31690 [Pirellulaceae bacterium]
MTAADDEKRIFYAALAVSDPNERTELLNHLCEDADLRSRINFAACVPKAKT